MCPNMNAITRGSWIGLARARPDLVHAWAFYFITQAGLGHFSPARLIDVLGLDLVG